MISLEIIYADFVASIFKAWTIHQLSCQMAARVQHWIPTILTLHENVTVWFNDIFFHSAMEERLDYHLFFTILMKL